MIKFLLFKIIMIGVEGVAFIIGGFTKQGIQNYYIGFWKICPYTMLEMNAMQEGRWILDRCRNVYDLSINVVKGK